ncbi:MAG TPA: tail fiber domain-containing protein [Flavobacteriales bacterium]|nr:tail fiber domain-containing protein [Flavobacteriales bacterium]
MTSATVLRLHYNSAEVGYWTASSGVYTATSDRRLKKNIEPVLTVLPNLRKLDVVKYHFKRNEDESIKKQWGFIAQDVIKLFPELVDEGEKEEGQSEAYYGINYDNFGVLAIKAIQEQQAMIDELKKQVTELMAKQNQE